jgi:DnaJ-class molecular chaperone
MRFEKKDRTSRLLMVGPFLFFLPKREHDNNIISSTNDYIKMNPTHYQVLGVSPEATHEEIKNAFHRLARQCHPDKSSSSSSSSSNSLSTMSVESFRQIQQAWEILRDERQRKVYNDQLHHLAMKEKAKRGGVVRLQWKELEQAQDEETGEVIHVYDCRCGEEIVVESSSSDSSSPDDTSPPTTATEISIECPGCCFVYQLPIRALS